MDVQRNMWINFNNCNLEVLRIEQGGLGVKRDALFEELSIYLIKDESCV